MRHALMRAAVAVAAITSGGLAACTAPEPLPASQNPSPMVERTRAHGRILEADSVSGTRHIIDGVLPSPVRLFVPAGAGRDSARLLVHFHGAAFVGEHAAASNSRDYIVATVNLGSGSRAYEQPLTTPGMLDRLIGAAEDATGIPEFDGIVLSGFSAGYGAIRALLRDSAAVDRIDAVLLLDGLHTGYAPDGLVLHEGGTLDTVLLQPFIAFARRAVGGEKRFIITHSEIFPGTFASTTETTDHIIGVLGLDRVPILDWGPLGMQQLSVARAGSFAILGYAGNTAPDHIDHLHALPQFLEELDDLPAMTAR